MRLIRGVSIVSTVALVGALVCAASRSGAASGAVGTGWLEPTVGLDPQGAYLVAVVAGDGLAVAVWDNYLTGVQVSARRSGMWEPPVMLTRNASFPQLAIDAKGNTLLTLASYERGWQVVSYVRAAVGGWSDATLISTPEEEATDQDLAANDAGQAVVTWRTYEGTTTSRTYVIRAAIRAADGSWGSPLNLGYGDEAPKAAIDAAGNVLVLWRRNGALYAAHRPAAGAWQPTTMLAPETSCCQVEVVMNRRGDALAVWGGPEATIVSARRSAETGEWTTPVRVPLTSPQQTYLGYAGSFVLDEQGRTTLVEGREDGQVESLTLPADGEQWGGPQVLGSSGGPDIWYGHDPACVRPQVVLDQSGGRVVVWGGSTLSAVRQPPGSTRWEQPVVVTRDHTCFQLALATDDQGNAVVLFNGTEAQSAARLDAATLDVTPPLIDSVRAPRAAAVGKRGRFSLVSRDLWSRVTKVEWRFGDGRRVRVRGADGNSTVTHIYRRPGRYLVTVTASDAAGNSVRRTVTVVARLKRR
jgi:hypothetical protein